MSMFNHLCVSNTLWRGLRFELLYITRSTEVIIFLPHFLEVMKRNLQKFQETCFLVIGSNCMDIVTKSQM